MDDETLFSQCPVASGCVISFSVFYRNLFLYYYHYHYCYFIYLFFTRFWLSGIVFCWFHVWINFISASSLVGLFCPGCSLFVVFFNFGLLGFPPEFVIFSFVIHYGQLSPWMVLVLGLDRCFHLDSLLYLVFSLNSYWPFVNHRSVNVMPCVFRSAYIGLK